MSSLESLTDEASRQFAVCNSCRYCEDYCAVFPAAQDRPLLTTGDLSYLANVCHDCRACYQACMYVAPHEFDLNLPALLSAARTESYEYHARPRVVARVLHGGPLALATACLASLVLLFVLTWTAGTLGSLFGVATGAGAFYKRVPHLAMEIPALVISAIVLTVAARGTVDFWRASGGALPRLLSPRLWTIALWEAATLRWMRGGGGECFYPDDERPAPVRRRVHQLMAAGFLATFAATLAAFVYEYLLNDLPPYDWLTVPVQLGIWGGAAVAVGSTWLLVLKGRAPKALSTAASRRQDYTLLVALDLVAITGVLLLVLRSTSLLGTLLVIHLSMVYALMLTAPYGKFVHVVYRLAALVRSADERSARSGSMHPSSAPAEIRVIDVNRSGAAKT